MNEPIGRGVTRLCVISDIHGNLRALDAVLSEVRRVGADMVMVAGDLVAQGPRPAETLDMLRAVPERLMIRGNTDRYLVAPGTTPSWAREREERLASLAWTREQLGDERLTFLAGLPEQVSLDSCLLVHGSPGNDEKGVFPDTPPQRFDSEAWTSVLLCGHTHVPVHRHVDGRQVVNAGSAGWPLDGDPRPSFAVLERGRGDAPWTAELRRVDYDREKTIEDLERQRVPWRHTVRGFITTASGGRQSAPA